MATLPGSAAVLTRRATPGVRQHAPRAVRHACRGRALGLRVSAVSEEQQGQQQAASPLTSASSGARRPEKNFFSRAGEALKATVVPQVRSKEHVFTLLCV